MPIAIRLVAAFVLCALAAGCATLSDRSASMRRAWIHETSGPVRSDTLLIVLHGTKASPEDEARSWHAPARSRGWDLLSYGHPDAGASDVARIHRDIQSLVRRLEQERGKAYSTLRYAGSSRGGRLAIALAILSRASAVASMAGAPEEIQQARSEVRVLLVYGENDPTPEVDRRRAEQALREAGYRTAYRGWPGQGHFLDASAYEDAARWLEAEAPGPQR